jgi:hypothetical protein
MPGSFTLINRIAPVHRLLSDLCTNASVVHNVIRTEPLQAAHSQIALFCLKNERTASVSLPGETCTRYTRQQNLVYQYTILHAALVGRCNYPRPVRISLAHWALPASSYRVLHPASSYRAPSPAWTASMPASRRIWRRRFSTGRGGGVKAFPLDYAR